MTEQVSRKDGQIIGIIPSYMPDEKLGETVSGTLAVCRDMHRLIVIDDGSGSDFAAVFEKIGACDPRVEVLHLGVNSGMGGAIKAGLQYAIHRYPQAYGFVMFDADGQHDPADVARVMAKFREKPEAFVIGVREYHDSTIEIPLRSRFGNRVTEVVFRACTGVHLTDTQSGLRCYPRDIAAKCTQIEKSRYEFQLEALILAVEGAECVQIPIRTIYEENNRRSHFRPVIDSLRIYSVFLRFISSSLICFALDYVVFAVAYILSQSILTSLVISKIISCSTNFLINKIGVFRSPNKLLHEAVSFAVLALVLATLSYYGVVLFADKLGMSPLISKIIVETTLFICSFLVQRFYVFARRSKPV